MNSFKLCVFLFELLCLIITTQEQYAPLVVNSKFLEPAINLKPFSGHENDKAPAYVSSHYKEDESPLYFFCPLQTNTEGENVLIYRQQYENNIFLDEPTPVTCELPIRGVFENLRLFPENTEYEMGLLVYKKVIESENEIITANSWNSYIIPIFNFTFNEKLKMIISASYQINAPPFMNITSNNKTIIPYDKNLKLLISPLDERYKYFETEVLPLMLKEFDDSLLNLFCKIYIIPREQCTAEIKKSDEFKYFLENWSYKMEELRAGSLGVQKVQLIPKDDFITDAKKNATYADVLTIPIWKALLFKWNAVEIFLRKLAKITGNLKVESGVSGTLQEVKTSISTNNYMFRSTYGKLYTVRKILKKQC